jgi:hypothetical protein
MIDDLIWAWRMFRAKRFRRTLIFSHRERHSHEFTHVTGSGRRTVQPDGVFLMQKEDFDRAYEAAKEPHRARMERLIR